MAELAIHGGPRVADEPFPAWPSIDAKGIEKAAEVLRSGKVNYWTGSTGHEFEQAFARYCDARFAISTTNGTAALHTALASLGVGPGDEVICPSYSFIASSFCIMQAGAIPVFADVDRTHTLSAEDLEAKITPRTRAIVVVHLYGVVADMEPILETARRHGLLVIEDCAQCLGGLYKGRKVGTLGDAGCFSFCQSKHFTTGGEGGAIVTNDEETSWACRSFRDHGYDVQERERLLELEARLAYIHSRIGFNYRMTEMQAAIGLCELDRFTSWNLARRRRNGQRLHEALVDHPLIIETPVDDQERQNAFWWAPYVVDTSRLSVSVNALAAAMAAEGVPIYTVQWPEMYREEVYTKRRGFGRLNLALRTSPLVILAGRSGTGKSLLPRYFAALLDAEFVPIQVQPQWADNADLLGYTPTLRPDTFIAGRLTDALREASAAPDRLFLALLDEMNLAYVEHYFSDFLSVVETRRKEDGEIVSDPLPLDLPRANNGDDYADLRGLGLPWNLRVIGTANMDETTQPFSPKVLDRAFTIEFDEVDLAAFATAVGGAGGGTTDFRPLASRLVDPSVAVSVTEALGQAGELFNAIAAQLVEVNQILEPVGASFAYRTRDATCLYMWHWEQDELDSVMPFEAALDYCLLQKVLPHVRGHGDLLEAALRDLIEWLNRDDTGTSATPPPYAKRPYLRSAAKAEKMVKRLVEVGATSFWEP